MGYTEFGSLPAAFIDTWYFRACSEEVIFPFMAKVVLHPDEPVKDALRRFKKLCDREGIVNRSKRITRYEKPSERRRRSRSERLKTIRKAQKTMR